MHRTLRLSFSVWILTSYRPSMYCRRNIPRPAATSTFRTPGTSQVLSGSQQPAGLPKRYGPQISNQPAVFVSVFLGLARFHVPLSRIAFFGNTLPGDAIKKRFFTIEVNPDIRCRQRQLRDEILCDSTWLVLFGKYLGTLRLHTLPCRDTEYLIIRRTSVKQRPPGDKWRGMRRG